MKKKSVYLILFLFTPIYFIYAQQISTNNTQQPNELIQNLIGSNCATASNVSSPINGSINGIVSYGSFNSDVSSFPLQSGLILSTGSVNTAGNSIISEDLNEGSLDWTTDADIETILGIDQTLNATSIEFDFETANNFVSFKYAFASDEYQQEYPCNFKDVFAILIKRAGTTDPYVNIATVPDTSTEISTNTIHPNISGFCDAQNADYFNGYNVGNTNFNGITEVLTARTDIIPNETYHIKLVIADHIDQRFDSAVFIEAEGFGGSINLGPDQSICGSDLTLDANINQPTANYTWFVNDGLIPGENNPTLEVSQSGTYDVEISIPSASNNCVLTDSIEIEIIPYQDAAPIEDWLACNPYESNGIYDFNFTLKNDEIYSNLPSTNYSITYHLSLEDAQNYTNPLTGIYQNAEESETIFVRIESLSGDCLQIGSFNIMVSDSTDTAELILDVCNGELVESAFYNLNFLGRVVSNFQLDISTSFYLTENDAIHIENALNEFPNLDNEPPLFYARIENLNSNTICPSIIPIHIDYIEQTDIGIERYIVDLCIDPTSTQTIDGIDYNYDNLPVDYNIDDIFDQMETEFPGIRININALLGLGLPPRILTTSNSYFEVPIAIRYLEENCPSYINIELHKNLLHTRALEVMDISKCDDRSNDGIVEFNLAEIVDDFKGDYDIDLQLYETEADLLAGNNPLEISTSYTVVNSQTLFMESSHNDCSLVSEINLNITERLYIPPTVVDYCGNTDPDTNSTDIVLEPLIDTVTEGLDFVGQVQFYLTEEDAENQNNELIGNHTITGDQQVIYVRVLDAFFSGCSGISTLEINIVNSINASNPDPLIICDDDQDLTATVNLENVIPQLSNGSDDLTFTFFENHIDAVNEESPISDPSNYTTTTSNLFIRADILGLECFTIFPYDIFIYADPQLNVISDMINCEANPNAPSSFRFVDKDIDIINEQNGMQVLYFETEEDATNRIDPIDKNGSYLSTSNPQTIFVRLENEAENSCYKIAPMEIVVRQAPIYNTPTDVFECDISNNDFATTDLNEKITEIASGSTTNLNITFHLSPLNAQVGANEIPLNYTVTSNPQLIYTRIENTNSGCYEIETFSINTLSLPEAIYGQSLTQCANNYNDTLEWNLTAIELDVLDGRQYNIAFTYFESEADLLTDNNPIHNPTTYTSNANQQTIYTKITNLTTGCFDVVPFDLIINNPPQINDFETYNICENTENQIDLLEINELLVDDTFNILISYHDNETDAEANENPLNSNYFYTNTTERLFARVAYSTTHCYVVYPFNLAVNSNPIANQPNNLMACDDDFDGLLEFDLAQQNASILGNQNPEDFSITFYNSESNAIDKVQSIATNYMAYHNETIFARLENQITGCFAVTQFSTVINTLPYASIEDQVICSSDLSLVVSAETNTPTDTYLWSTNATTPQIEILEPGTYSVTITNEFGCENTSTFNVIESEPAIIDVVETIDFSDPNNITVTIIGIGNYRYQLDDLAPQDSNVFTNVAMGYHTVTIIDLNGCSSTTKEVLVADIPKFFTPNNDGTNDTWHIVGVETLPGTIVSIFDRYGKLLTQLHASSSGWDGKYNGEQMPSSDYWFVAEIKQGDMTFEVKGHFALRR